MRLLHLPLYSHMIHGLNNFHHMKPPLLPIIVMIYLDSYVIIMHDYATPSMIQWSQASIVTKMVMRTCMHINYYILMILSVEILVYVIVLVIINIVIVASECSSKFANLKIIGKCNPVAVLDTVILLIISCAKLFKAILTSFS